MIFVLFSFLKASFGNEIIYSEKDIFYHFENRIHFEGKKEFSSFVFFSRSGILYPLDTIYISIDKAIASLNYKNFEVSFGRDNLFWGYGMFYSPFWYGSSSISPFDEELLKEGKNIFSLQYNNIPNITPEFIIFLPGDPPKIDSIKGGMHFSFFSSGLEAHFPIVFSKKAFYPGAGIRFSILGFIIFSDFSFEFSSKETFASTTGFNKIFGDNFCFHFEFFYNQKGLTKEEYDATPKEDLPKLLEPGGSGRKYIYSVIRWTDEINGIGLFSLVNPEWKSGILGIFLTSYFFENSLISLNYVRILKGREFDFIPYKNIFSIELRYYI
ncbi:MAG: hypothetical protein ABIN61_04260 [candidate division WOR-3 bacterium]